MSLDLLFDLPLPAFAPNEIPNRDPEAQSLRPDPVERPAERPSLDPVACARKLAALARVIVRR